MQVVMFPWQALYLLNYLSQAQDDHFIPGYENIIQGLYLMYEQFF